VNNNEICFDDVKSISLALSEVIVFDRVAFKLSGSSVSL
jgi:hypothetical protein